MVIRQIFLAALTIAAGASGVTQPGHADPVADLEAVIAGGEYRINGGAWTSAAGTIYPGDTVQARTTSAATLSTSVVATVTIGGVAGTFTVQTRSPDSNSQYVVTFRDSIYGAGY